MLNPYMRYPFISQFSDTMYPSQSPDLLAQQYSQQMTMPQYYSMQDSYQMYEDSNNFGIYSSTNSRLDPQLSNNPPTTNIVVFKELTAYPNYGNPSRNADILYTSNRGTWTFETPAFLFVPGNLRARIIIRAVLDDHSNVPVNRYSARITINGSVVHTGRLPLEHGTPAGGLFINWRELPFNITSQRRVTRVTIENTSSTGTNDWIAFDWMELRLLPR